MSDLTKANETRSWLVSWIVCESVQGALGERGHRTSAKRNAERFMRTAEELRSLLASYRSTGRGEPADLEPNIAMIEQEIAAALQRATLDEERAKFEAEELAQAQKAQSERLRALYPRH